MEHNPVRWFEIYVQDMARARAFYEGVFTTRLEKLNSPMPDMEIYSFTMIQDQYGANGALVKMKGKSSGGNSTIVYFACQDCAVEEARVEKHGGKIDKPKMSIGEYGFISLILDSEGNMLGLHSMQ